MHRSTGTQRHDDIANNRSLRSLYFFFLQISLNAFSILISNKLVSDTILQNFLQCEYPPKTKLPKKVEKLGKFAHMTPKNSPKWAKNGVLVWA